MNKIYKILSFTMVLSIITMSCDEDRFLTQVNPNAISTEIFWQSEGDAEAALVTVYAALQFYSIGGAGVAFRNMKSDLITTNNFTPWVAWNDLSIPANHALIAETWAEPYIGIFRANQVITNVPTIEADGFTDEAKNLIIAQARFLRAYYYFHIIHNFGKAILTTSVTGLDEDLYLEFSSIEEVTNTLIIPDLEFAAEHLPMAWDDTNVGRVTWGAAMSLLGKTHLYDQNWGAAVAAFEEVIDSRVYDLVSDPLDNFRHDTEHNIESILEIAFDADINPGVPNNLAYQTDNTPAASSTETQHIVRFFVPEALGGFRTILPTYHMHELMLTDSVPGSNALSPRLNASIVPQNYEGLYFGLTRPEHASKPWTFGESAYAKKYTNWYWQTGEGGQGRTSINFRLMRLADIYLMYAEAVLESTQDINTAIEFIDLVRERAGTVTLQSYIDANGTIPQLHVSRDVFGDYPEVAVTVESIRDHIRFVERPAELCFEGFRWNDLVRWGVVQEVLDARKVEEDARIERYSDSGNGDNSAPLFINGTFRRDFVNSQNIYNPEAHDYLPIPTLEIQLNRAL